MSLFTAFVFLTRLPIPVKGEIKESTLASSTAYFPIVGLALGGGMVLILRLTIFLPLTINIFLSLLFLVIVTGGLHLDGFMDTLDGLGCGGNRERILEVMKDSRVGAFGAVGVSLLILFKFLLVWELGMSGKDLLPLLISMAVVSRWSMVLVMYKNTYPRLKGGLGRAFIEQITLKELLISTFLSLAIFHYFFNYSAIYFLLVIAFVSFLIRYYFKSKLGGVTGDVLGFTNETMETVFLLINLL